MIHVPPRGSRAQAGPACKGGAARLTLERQPTAFTDPDGLCQFSPGAGQVSLQSLRRAFHKKSSSSHPGPDVLHQAE